MFKNTTLLLCNLLLCYIIIASTSCSLLKKHKTIYKSSIDSTSQVSEKKDSTVLKDIVAVSKDSSKTSDEIVIEFDNERDTTIYHTPHKPDDYFTITREGITTNKPIKSVRIKSSQNVFNYDSLADHSKIQESELKQSDTHVTKKEKEVTKEKEVKRFQWWWFVLLGLIILGGRWVWINRGKIKSAVIHFFTGL